MVDALIACMMRVKNEARWIERCVGSVLSLCDAVVILDDHSTDGTAEICERIPKTKVIRSPFSGLDETRDKNYLLAEVARMNPEWVLHIDGDEELEDDGPAKIRQTILSGAADAYKMQVVYLWDKPDMIRVDRWYADFCRPSLFRFKPGLKFESGRAAANFHCGNVPVPVGVMGRTGARLMHWGYIHAADRIRKYHWYNQKDPNNRAEDCYRHMVIGDLFPDDSVFRYAGPLELRRL